MPRVGAKYLASMVLMTECRETGSSDGALLETYRMVRVFETCSPD